MANLNSGSSERAATEHGGTGRLSRRQLALLGGAAAALVPVGALASPLGIALPEGVGARGGAEAFRLWQQWRALKDEREVLHLRDQAVDRAYVDSRPRVPAALSEVGAKLARHDVFRDHVAMNYEGADRHEVPYVTAEGARRMRLTPRLYSSMAGIAGLTADRCRELEAEAIAFTAASKRAYEARQAHPIEQEIEDCLDQMDRIEVMIMARPARDAEAIWLKLEVIADRYAHGSEVSTETLALAHEARSFLLPAAS